MANQIRLQSMIPETLHPLVENPVNLLIVGQMSGLKPMGQGSAPGQELRWTVSADGQTVAEGVITVATGEHFSFGATWTPSKAGDHELLAIVDTDNRLNESRAERRDNRLAQTLRVFKMSDYSPLENVPPGLGGFRVVEGQVVRGPATTADGGEPDEPTQPTGEPEPPEESLDWSAILRASMLATQGALSNWIVDASIRGTIHAAVVNFPDGSLKSSVSISEDMLARLGSQVPEPVAQAFSVVVEKSWVSWSSSWSCTWLGFPLFAALPMSHAPSTPMVPCPLSTGACGKLGMMDAAVLARGLTQRLGELATDPKAKAAILEFAGWLSFKFMAWYGQTLLSNVRGEGPIPTFSPPWGPLFGPVIGGTAKGTGVLAGPPL